MSTRLSQFQPPRWAAQPHSQCHGRATWECQPGLVSQTPPPIKETGSEWLPGRVAPVHLEGYVLKVKSSWLFFLLFCFCVPKLYRAVRSMKEICLLAVMSKVTWFISTSITSGKFMKTLKKKRKGSMKLLFGQHCQESLVEELHMVVKPRC